MTKETSSQKKPWVNWAIFLVTVVIVFLIGLFASSIIERRSESQLYFQMVSEIPDWEPRNEVWGQNFPREYESYVMTSDTSFKSKHFGSVTIDYLDKYPELVVMWAGYAFARDYKQGRGHYYAIDDIRLTLRTIQPQPGTCWACKSTDVPRVMNEIGIAEFYKKPWIELGAQIVNHIGCQDCHDPKTMNLRITRPGLIEAFERQGRNINDATHQEMRSLVCAQCHVEYYFKGDGKYLTFPWDGGFTMEAMEEYFDKAQYADWTHSVSKAPMLKAQHPDYELFILGTHGKRGLSCADCHMPYIAEGGIKYSDHQVMSPLKNISSTCQTCHRDSEEELRNYVYEYQDKALEIRDRVEVELAKAHIMAKIAWDNGAKEARMKDALQLIRQAQWRWDFGVASHGGSFHAPVETQRILAHGLDRSMQAQMELQKILFELGVTKFEMPDISTKAKAQKFIGLDMEKLEKDKENWLKTTPPAWIETARANGRLAAN